MIDLLLSIALYGGVALCLERWATFNSWLYGKVRGGSDMVLSKGLLGPETNADRNRALHQTYGKIRQ